METAAPTTASPGQHCQDAPVPLLEAQTLTRIGKHQIHLKLYNKTPSGQRQVFPKAAGGKQGPSCELVFFLLFPSFPSAL